MTLFKRILLLTADELNMSVILQAAAMADPKGAELTLMQFSNTFFDQFLVVPIKMLLIFHCRLSLKFVAHSPPLISVKYKPLSGCALRTVVMADTFPA